MYRQDFNRALSLTLAHPPLIGTAAIKTRLTKLRVEWCYDRYQHCLIIHNGNTTTVLYALAGVTDTEYKKVISEIGL